MKQQQNGISRRVRIFGTGLLFGIGGTLGVFLLILAMNEPPAEKEENGEQRAVAFDVAPPPPPPQPKPKAKPKPRKQKRSAKAKAATPQIQTALDGFSFDLPAFESGDVVGDSLGMLGDDLTNKDVVMTENSVDAPPRPLSGNRPPAYPRSAAKMGITGTVTLKLLVTAGGEVKNIRVLTSSPPGVFDEAALNAVRRWMFSPATYQGQPVSMIATLPIVFEQG